MCNLPQFIIVLTLLKISDLRLTNAVPAIFVFGDSLLDPGNNNYIKTLGKANFKPNGIDFGGPTGRFTNGRTVVDIFGQLIGVNGFIPPYMAPSTKGFIVLKGVNYASGSAGILNSTGKIAIKNINMDAQLSYFLKTSESIRSMIGKYAAQKLLNTNALFMVAIGANDFILNYLLPIISRRKQGRISPHEFVYTLIERLRIQLKKLYDMDARKFIVSNIPPIGCTPAMKDTNPTTGPDRCFERANMLAQMFNSQLEKLIFELRRELKGSAFIYVNIYHIFSSILQNHKSYGFDNAKSACCRFLGKYGGIFSCHRLSRICKDRSKYVFWDGFHPSEAVNVIVAKHVLDGKAPDVSPNNVRQLLKCQTNWEVLQ